MANQTNEVPPTSDEKFSIISAKEAHALTRSENVIQEILKEIEAVILEKARKGYVTVHYTMNCPDQIPISEKVCKILQNAGYKTKTTLSNYKICLYVTFA